MIKYLIDTLKQETLYFKSLISSDSSLSRFYYSNSNSLQQSKLKISNKIVKGD